MSRTGRRIVLSLVVSSGLLWAALGLLRWSTFHNETFDLAFYVRMAWGLARFEFWDPIVGAHVFGLHLSPVLVLLGVFGYWPGALPPVLILVQAFCLAAAALPLARFAARRLGDPGAVAVAAAWWLHPTPGHVGSFEVHPGTMAVLPLAWAVDAVDRGCARELVLASVGVLLCREDLGLVLAAICTVAVVRRPELRFTAVLVGAAALGWVAFFALVLLPELGPPVGSMQLHFGDWGDSLGEVLRHLWTHPEDLIAHLGAPRRLFYPAALLAPLAFLPLLRPWWLLAAAPPLGINLLSSFPTTLDLDVHYLVPALPGLFAAAVEGAGALARAGAGRFGAVIVWVAAAAGAQVVAGATPLSPRFTPEAFRFDEDSRAAAAALAAIPPEASVQAPDPLLPHLAERRRVHRAPPPERGVDRVVLDAAHRARFAGREDLLRTEQEPFLRTWLARPDHRLIAAPGRYLVLAREPAGDLPAVGHRWRVGRTDQPDAGLRLSETLVLRAAALSRDVLRLELAAGGPAPSDLAVRLGTGYRPHRVDLLFDGELSPAALEAGWVVESRHRLTPGERRRIEAGGLRVGLLRQSGARPAPGDPTAVSVPLGPEGRYRCPGPAAGGRPSAVPSTP